MRKLKNRETKLNWRHIRMVCPDCSIIKHEHDFRKDKRRRICDTCFEKDRLLRRRFIFRRVINKVAMFVPAIGIAFAVPYIFKIPKPFWVPFIMWGLYVTVKLVQDFYNIHELAKAKAYRVF